MDGAVVGATDVLEQISEALDYALRRRDEYTHDHSSRVVDLAMALGRKCGLKAGELSMLRACARFHDIGKIGIPDSILLKPGRLTPDEFSVITSHSDIGATIIGRVNIPLIDDYAKVILQHHEWMDGSGYPDGIAGSDICLGARIISIADCYDAMVSRRTYGDSMPREVALEIMRSETGTHFDPGLTEAFFQLVG